MYKWFLPFEKIKLKSSKTLDDIFSDMDNLIDNTMLFDTNKPFRDKIKNKKIHIYTNLGFIYKTQHYYIKQTNKDISSFNDYTITSCSNLLNIIFYVFFLVIGLFGLISKIIVLDLISILIVILWVYFIWFLLNGLQKLKRKVDVKTITSFF